MSSLSSCIDLSTRTRVDNTSSKQILHMFATSSIHFISEKVTISDQRSSMNLNIFYLFWTSTIALLGHLTNSGYSLTWTNGRRVLISPGPNFIACTICTGWFKSICWPHHKAYTTTLGTRMIPLAMKTFFLSRITASHGGTTGQHSPALITLLEGLISHIRQARKCCSDY